MVVPGCPSHSQLEVKHPKTSEPQEAEEEFLLQPTPHSETLHFPNPRRSSFHVQTSLQSDDHGKLHQKDDQPTTLPKPSNHRGHPTKRKKGSGRKVKRGMQKILNLTDALNPIPFIPKYLDLAKHEDVLKRLGLDKFTKIEFDRSIRTDLLIQLIANFDSKKRCSYVNEKRINVSRAALASALKLPVTKRGPAEEVDLDSEVFSNEVIGFIEDFVFNWLLIHEESWDIPVEILNWIRCIRDGHPEKLDSASLIWYKVEKELTQGYKLADCYYASHLQCLIRSQKDQLFMEEDVDVGEENVKADEELKEKEEQEVKVLSLVQERDVDDVEESVKADEELEEKEEQEVKVSIVQERDVDEGEEFLKAGEEQDGKEEHDEKQEQEEIVSVAQEGNVELTLAPDVEKTVSQMARKDDEMMMDTESCEVRKDDTTLVDTEKCEVRKDGATMVDTENCEVRKDGATVLDTEKCEGRNDDETMVDTEECKEGELEEQVNWKNGLSEPILQRCQHSDLNDFEEMNVEQMEDEDVVILEEEGSGERFTEGFDIEANDDLMDNFHAVPNFDVFRPRDNLFMSHGGPSFFDNGSKRVMDPEEDMHHLDGNSKRLKTDKMWDHKQNDFNLCIVEMQQWMEKAKMIQQSKEASFINSQCHQNLAIGQLQERNQMMEMVIKSKDEELKKKDTEKFRLERELYLMMDCLAGYRKALNDTRFKFKEYRRRVAHQEEPLYKDAGPGGLVLSSRELEKRRLKQEERMMMKIQTLVKSYEEDGVYQLNILSERVLQMDEKLAYIRNEVKKLKEIKTQRKAIQKPRVELILSPKHEQNRKSHDEDSENDASKEIVAPDANESELQEKVGDEEY